MPIAIVDASIVNQRQCDRRSTTRLTALRDVQPCVALTGVGFPGMIPRCLQRRFEDMLKLGSAIAALLVLATGSAQVIALAAH